MSISRKAVLMHGELITAWGNGEEIQYSDFGEWLDVEEPEWSLKYEYRVKPKPITLYGASSKVGYWSTHNTLNEAEEKASDILRYTGFVSTVKEFVEVVR